MTDKDIEMLKIVYGTQIEKLRDRIIKLETTLIFLINGLESIIGKENANTFVEFLKEKEL